MDSYEKISDDELVKIYLFSDELAFEEIYNRYYRLVYNLCRKGLVDNGLAEDAVQVVFLKVSNRLSAYDQKKSSLKSYICMIAKGEISDFRQSQTKWSFFEKLKEIFYRGDRRMDKHLLTKEIEVKMLTAIKTLPKIDQTIFDLRFYADMKIADIAIELNMPENSIKTHLVKIKTILMNLLGDTYFNGIDE